jgi:hypothetical protein
MADAIPRLLDPFRLSELADSVGVSRVSAWGWRVGRHLPVPYYHEPLARALVALRGGSLDDPEAVSAAKAEVLAAYRADLADRSRAGRTAT